MDSNDIRREKIAKYVKWGLVLAGCAIISPVIFLAIKGMVGLAVAGVIGLVWVNLAPVLSMKLANLKIKGIVSEAQQNPIETLQNLLIEKHKAYVTFRDNVTTAATAAKDFASKVEELKRRYPNRAAEFNNQVNAINELIRRKYAALNDAKHSIEEGEEKLDEMKSVWEVSQAAQAANKAANMDINDAYAKLKADTAVDSVMTSMNRAFAELETAAAEAGPSTQTLLTHQPADAITVQVKEKQGARV